MNFGPGLYIILLFYEAVYHPFITAGIVALILGGALSVLRHRWIFFLIAIPTGALLFAAQLLFNRTEGNQYQAQTVAHANFAPDLTLYEFPQAIGDLKKVSETIQTTDPPKSVQYIIIGYDRTEVGVNGVAIYEFDRRAVDGADTNCWPLNPQFPALYKASTRPCTHFGTTTNGIDVWTITDPGTQLPWAFATIGNTRMSAQGLHTQDVLPLFTAVSATDIHNFNFKAQSNL